MAEDQLETTARYLKEETKHENPQETIADKETRGFWEALQFVDRVAKDKKREINEQVVTGIHRQVMGHFHNDVAGKYRYHGVAISGAVFLPPEWPLVERMMKQFGEELTERTKSPKQSIENTDEVIDTAAWAHYQFIRIHPFIDGNGRTARLLTDLIFKRAGLYVITDWNHKDGEYIKSLKRVDETGNLSHFKRFLAQKQANRHNHILNSLNNHNSIREHAKQTFIIENIKNRQQQLLKIATNAKD